MEQIIYCLKIVLYFVIVFFSYYLMKNSNEKYKKGERSKRISIIIISIICTAFGGYSLICGSPIAFDRYNYALRFSDDIYLSAVKSNSLGLYYIELFLHIFSHKEELLFFAIPFLYIFITLFAYRKSNDIEPLAILFLLLSSYGLFGFYLFKQCIAISLIAISFVAYTNKKKMLFIISIVLAICFHESSWIVIPLYIASMSSGNKIFRVMSYLLIIICAIFFAQLNQALVQFANLIPGVEQQVSIYLNNEGGIEETTNILTVIKGVPFYIITIFGFLKRPILKNKIKNYDVYMLFSAFTCLATILSGFMYWMWRFGAFCYFPILVFASLIHRELKNQKEKVYFKYCIIFTLFGLTLKLLIQYYFKYGGF